LLILPSTDLPPSTIAKPLPVSKSAKSNGIFTSETPARKAGKRKRTNDADDTPKAFARLMMFQSGKRLRSGLDDGVKQTKKQKKAAAAAKKDLNDGKDGKEGKEGGNANAKATAKAAEEKFEIPTIQPGEKMSDFSARVNAALPISGLINKTGKNGKDPLGLKVGRTKTEKRMHRMYAEWREQEAKIQEKREEALELAEEEQDDEEGMGVKWKVDMEAEESSAPGKKKKGKKGKKKIIGEVAQKEEDPWAALAKKRGEAKARLHDVVLAPPTFTKIPKEKFKVRGARVDVEDVPKSAGSLRRREELGEVRKTVVEAYRQMMKDNMEKMKNEKMRNNK
jgi:hypothetical protein